jgi:prepilin-type N-terminal cleavage/methylation domain-containing protein
VTRRAFSLVELMIAVAILGITAALAGHFDRQARVAALELLQRERARLVLEYRAEVAAHGAPFDPHVEQRLIERLPGARVIEEREPGMSRLRVSWEVTGKATASRELVVLRAGESP